MTRCDFSLKNNTPYDIKLLSADGSDWGKWLGWLELKANGDQMTKIEDMGCPGAAEPDHWVDITQPYRNRNPSLLHYTPRLADVPSFASSISDF